jgi:hypothetical protein
MTVEAPGSLVIETIASFLLFPADISSAMALFSVNKHFNERVANMRSFWRAKCAEFGFSFERTKTEGDSHGLSYSATAGRAISTFTC